MDDYFEREWTREDFEKFNKSLLDRVMQPVYKVMNETGLTKEQISRIILVGGSSRIPYVHRLLADYFGGIEKIKFHNNPDEVVAHGAAWRAYMIAYPEKFPGFKFINNYERQTNDQCEDEEIKNSSLIEVKTLYQDISGDDFTNHNETSNQEKY